MTPDGSFASLGEAVRYRGQIVEVVTATFAGPDGRPFERDVVHHPGAVAVVAVHDGGDGPQVVLVRQFRPALGRDSLELPAGLRDVDGEDAEATARRELREEAGFEAGRMTHLVTIDTAPGFADESIVVFLATELAATDREADGAEEEHMVVELVRWADLAGLVLSGSLRDAKTLAGLWAASLHLGS